MRMIFIEKRSDRGLHISIGGRSWTFPFTYTIRECLQEICDDWGREFIHFTGGNSFEANLPEKNPSYFLSANIWWETL